MTLQDRIDNYARETKFPQGLFIGGDGRIAGIWILGNNYRVKSGYYGGYPAGYLHRIKALFPDKSRILHLFSGNVDTVFLPGVTVDINPECNPDIVDDAHTLKKVPLQDFDLILADPPYSVEDCEHYGCAMVNRNAVISTLESRLAPKCHICWLDQVFLECINIM